MEFKFRAGDDRPPSFFRPPPNVSESVTFFTEQALRVGYSTNNELTRNDLFQHPMEMRESIQLEHEKDRIREEIIAAEIARKRMLEAEVRREMMIEREMALRRAHGFSLFSTATPSSAAAMQFDSRFSMLLPPQPECGESLEERIGRMLVDRFGMSIEERTGFQGRMDFGNFNFRQSRCQLTLEDVQTPEVKSLPEPNKEKLIFLAKPGPTLSGTKRKAVTPPAVGPSELPSASSKKPKEEWSCALCQVSATSEKALDDHLQGKKHKTKEAGLIAQEVGKKYGTAPLTRKHVKPTKPADRASTSRLEQGGKLEGESLQVNKTEGTKFPTARIAKDLKKKRDKPPMQEKPKAETKKKNRKVEVQKTLKKVKKFKSWCEICQIGAHSEVVMKTHKQGKKHMTRLQELGQNCGIVPAPTILSLLESVPKANDEEVSEKTNENADAVMDGLASSSAAS